jgi:hypothetical protein
MWPFLLVIGLLLLTIGIIIKAMQVYRKTPGRKITVFFTLAGIILSLISVFNLPSTAPSVQVANPPATPSAVAYAIINEDKGSFDRLLVDVVVKEPASVDQLKAIGHKLVEDAKARYKFRGLIIDFYDYPEFVGKGITLGKIIYAPRGEIAADMSVKPGDFAKMIYSYDLKKKDWSKRLTSDEVGIWAQWSDYLLAKRKANDTRSEEVICAEFASTNNIPAQKVAEISFKYTAWLL